MRTATAGRGRGNGGTATLWDWLHLLVLPLLVPTVIVPMLTPKAMGEIVYLDADGNPIEVLTTVGDGPAAVDVTPSVAVSPDLAPPAPAPSDR